MTITQLEQPNPEATPYEPILTLSVNLEDLARKHHFRLDQGKDDLDAYQVAHLELDESTQFLLVRYSGMPPNTIELYVKPPVCMHHDSAWRIVQALGLSKQDAHLRDGTDFE